jgi:hypothetical protein
VNPKNSHKNFTQKFHTKISHKNFTQKFRTKISHKKFTPQREMGIPEDVVGIVPMITPPLIFMPDPNIGKTPEKLPPVATPQPEPRRSTCLLIKEMTKVPPDNHEAQMVSVETNRINTDEYDTLSLLTAFLVEEKTQSHKTPKSQTTRNGTRWS